MILNLVILEGANHYSINQYLDLSDGGVARDFSATPPQDKIRFLLGETSALFIEGYILNQESASDKLIQLLKTNNDLIAYFDRK